MGHPQSATAGNDGHLVHAVGPRQVPGCQRVTNFVIGGFSLLFLCHHFFTFGTHQDLVAGIFEVIHFDDRFIMPRGPESCLIHNVANVGAGEPNRVGSKTLEIHLIRQWNIAHVNLEDLVATIQRRFAHRDVPVKASGSQQRRIQHVRSIRRGDNNRRFAGIEPIHLTENLIQRLLAFVVPATKPRSTLAPNGINFVNENDGRRVLAGRLEQIANPTSPHTHKHLDKLTAVDREEGNSGLSRHRACQ